MAEYRLYGKPNCSLFDLVGNKEPDQTKGLGLLLSESTEAMKSFLHVIGKNYPADNECIVDCELRQQRDNNLSYRADIVIRFYDNFTPKCAIVVEAKSVSANTTPQKAAEQLVNYVNEFELLQPFVQNKKITLVVLTGVNATIDNSFFPFEVKCITWADVVDAFANATKKGSITFRVGSIV